MKILIIEDEVLAAERLAALLKEIDSSCEIVAMLRSVEASINWLKKEDEPDLIISDIQLLDSICFDIFEAYKPTCQVIFATAYDHYAIQAFEVNSIDYLLKPIQKEKLSNSLIKYHQLKGSTKGIPNLEDLTSLISSQPKEFKSRFLVKIGNKIKSITVENVAYFFTQDKMTYLVDQENKRFPIDLTLEEIDQVVNPSNFFRVNRKYVVSFQCVSEIHPYFKGRLKIALTPSNNDDIVVSSDKTPNFKAWLDK